MYQWTDEQEMVRGAVRQFIDKEIRPNIEELEHGDTPPYEVLRKMFRESGWTWPPGRASRSRSSSRRRSAAQAAGEAPPEKPKRDGDGGASSLTLIPIIELCKVCPGMVTAMGVSMGLTSAAISSKGTIAQKERWVPELLTMEKVGAWAITEPNSGSDAFGSMKSTARKDGDEYVPQRLEDVHHQRPLRRHDRVHLQARRGQRSGRSQDLELRPRLGHAGLEQSAAAQDGHALVAHGRALPRRRVGIDRLVGETEDVAGRAAAQGAKATFMQERSGVAAMALGIIEECLALSVDYAKNRVQFGEPIGNFQLIQDKLARMEVAFPQRGEPGVPHHRDVGRRPLHDPRRGVGHEAHSARRHRGGPRRRADLRRQRLHERVPRRAARSRTLSKVLQIYAGTDEIQITHIAKDLLRR
ncbi:MAG: acyl-CoA dehydrogenase family protein [Acidimicrobiales bacterium]